MLEKLILAIAITICIKLLLGIGVPASREPAKPNYQVVESTPSVMKVISPRNLRQQLAFKE